MDVKLKRCPFCGGKGELMIGDISCHTIEDGYIHFSHYYVECLRCGCKTREFHLREKLKFIDKNKPLERIVFSDGYSEAIESWNNRTSSKK